MCLQDIYAVVWVMERGTGEWFVGHWTRSLKPWVQHCQALVCIFEQFLTPVSSFVTSFALALPNWSTYVSVCPGQPQVTPVVLARLLIAPFHLYQ